MTFNRLAILAHKKMNTDDQIYSRLVDFFPHEDPECILEIIEDLKGGHQPGELTLLEHEIWETYLALRRTVSSQP